MSPRTRWKLFYRDARAIYRQLDYLPERFDDVKLNGRVLDWANGPSAEGAELEIFAVDHTTNARARGESYPLP